MTTERGMKLMSRSLEIGKQILFESEIAQAASDLKKLNYLNQEMIVLRKITEVIGCVVFYNFQNNEEI